MTLTILYFAWVRERIGQAEESLTLPPEVTTVAQPIGLGHRLGIAAASRRQPADQLRHRRDLRGTRERLLSLPDPFPNPGEI